MSVRKGMQQAVKAAFVDEHGGPLAHPGLGMVGHGKAGGGHHFKIIGAVAHGDGLLGGDAQQAAHVQQGLALHGAVHDVAPALRQQAARELALPDFKLVAAGEIQRQALAQTLGKPGEAAAEQQRFQPRRLGGQNEFRRAGAGAQALLPHTLQLRLAHALQQGHAAAQALLEIGDFAAHGRFGDGGHFSAAPCGGGDFVHALDVDEGGVHVKSDEPEMAQRRQGGGAAHEQAQGDFAQGRGR